MKQISILTIFPKPIISYLQVSILKKAQDKNLVKFQVIDWREYTTNNYAQVDDYQYGGGSGMVLMLPPIYEALKQFDRQKNHIILLSPRGKQFNQKIAYNYAMNDKNLVFIAGHYEGIDERINYFIDETLSIGDYVITGGELASLVVIDATVRLIPGVINENSLLSESFNDLLLDHPVYTKPQTFLEWSVPEILLSGHHQKISEFRLKERIRITKQFRPDIYKKYVKKQK